MFDKIINFFKNLNQKEKKENASKDTAKERLHLVLMQDRANVSADFLELMKQEIIEVIKKYIDVDEGSIDVRLTNKQNEDGTTGAPALYANIPIVNVRNDMKKEPLEEKNNIDSNEDNEIKEEQEETTQGEKENVEPGNEEEHEKEKTESKDNTEIDTEKIIEEATEIVEEIEEKAEQSTDVTEKEEDKGKQEATPSE